jgi:hypothetical protein
MLPMARQLSRHQQLPQGYSVMLCFHHCWESETLNFFEALQSWTLSSTPLYLHILPQMLAWSIDLATKSGLKAALKFQGSEPLNLQALAWGSVQTHLVCTWFLCKMAVHH